MKWNKIKSTFFQNRMFGMKFKHGAIASGIVAQGLLVTGSIGITTHPVASIGRILYAFVILLPIAYYQMRMSENMGE